MSTEAATGGDYEIHPSFPSSSWKFDASCSSGGIVASTSEITPTARRGNRRSHRFDRRTPLTRSRTVSKRIDGAFRKKTIWLIAQEFGRRPLFVLQIPEFYLNAQVDPSGEIIHISQGIGAQNVSVFEEKANHTGVTSRHLADGCRCGDAP